MSEMAPYPHQPAEIAPGSTPGSGMATAGMILGITSIIFCWWGLFSLAQVVLAITFGAVGIKRAGRGAAGKGQAVAGLCCGIVGLIAYVIFGIATVGIGFLI